MLEKSSTLTRHLNGIRSISGNTHQSWDSSTTRTKKPKLSFPRMMMLVRFILINKTNNQTNPLILEKKNSDKHIAFEDTKSKDVQPSISTKESVKSNDELKSPKETDTNRTGSDSKPSQTKETNPESESEVNRKSKSPSLENEVQESKIKATDTHGRKSPLIPYGMGNTNPTVPANHMKTFNVLAPPSQVYPVNKVYANTQRSPRIKAFVQETKPQERKHLKSPDTGIALREYLKARDVVREIQKKFQTEYQREYINWFPKSQGKTNMPTDSGNLKKKLRDSSVDYRQVQSIYDDLKPAGIKTERNHSERKDSSQGHAKEPRIAIHK